MAKRDLSHAAHTLIQQAGGELDRLIERKGLSRYGAAKMFNQPSSYIAKQIRGRNMTLRHLADLFDRLGAEVHLVVKLKRKRAA